MATMGIDPVTASLAIDVGKNLLTGLFSPAPAAGPSAAELAAIAAAKQNAATETLLIAGGVALLGVLGYVLISRK